jgi:hypothetical protein
MSDTMNGIDVSALERMIATNPDEVRRLLNEADSEKLVDRYGRTLHTLDKVITPNNEVGMVIRLDRGSRRVLLELPDGRTRLLMAHRVEVKRGRPRKDSLRAVHAAS